ncbi:MAG: gliding motility-associated C-terminal domain-containing protein [Sphingobacteriaceae bacterium]|nr:gliding motility-associated C-terminal domain-containing protein [Sphingobacteriaceae bacterium]
MKKNTKIIAILFAIITLAISDLSAQVPNKVFANFCKNYNFGIDSLNGFDEQSASAAAISEGFTGEEFPVKMWQLKREFVNSKYGLWPQVSKKTAIQNFNFGNNVVVPACTNEDFEASTPAPLTGINQIAGWSITSGNVQGINDACNLLGCCPNPPYQGALIDCPSGTGYIDPNIGGVYPIYSVFGTGANNGNGINPQISFPMQGTKVIRINNNQNNYSLEKLSKTFAVTPQNAVFQFAFMSVFSTGHGCCDASSFKILVSVGGNTLSCPQFSVAAPSAQCTTVTPMPYYLMPSGNPYTGGNAQVFSKWFINSLDLTAYLGQNVTLDIIVADCTAGGHWGQVYFDAQCLPMDIIGNGQGFPAGTPSITLPTCGANGATITAPPGLGPYSWNSGQISIPAPLTVPNNTNTTLVTNQSGTLILTMQPPGSCAPINKVITVSITPAPIALISATQAGCTNSLSVAQLTTAGSASVNSTITWSPIPGSLSGNSLTATGLPIGITTVVVQDPLGCKVTLTLNVLPAPPPVTFTVNNLTGSYSITCINPTINLQAVSNYTYGTLNYFWSSPSFTSNQAQVGITAANNITVTATDPATGCFTTEIVSIAMFTTQPTNTVNPLSQAITCNSGAPVTFSGTVSNPTVNIQHDWYSPLNPLPGGVPIATSNNTISILSGAIPPGVYTLVTTNQVNGCSSAKTVTVTSLSAWPTFSLSSPTNFSVGCAPLNSTTLSIINPVSTQTPPATCSYTFLAPTFTGVVTPSVILGNNSSTVTTLPGTWTIIVQDNSNFCRTTIQVPVLQNTVAPNVSASLFTPTLTCKNPTVIATGTTTTGNTIITWNVPSTPPTLSTPTVVIGDPANGPNTSTTSLTYANFTVVATNTLNACQSTSVVQINQNFKPPISSPTISIATPTAIYCNAGSAPVVLTTGSSTTTSGGGPSAFVANPYWEGPSPQGTVAGASSYSCYVPGVYSLTIEDNYNGCKHTGTVNVLDRTQPPVITNAFATSTLDCGGVNTAATLSFALTGTMTGGIRYLVTEYPSGTAFTPTNAIQVNLNPLLSGTASQSVSVDKLGEYEYIVSNTLTGCQAIGHFTVLPGGLNADFTPDAPTGYAPHTVGFQNTSASSGGSGSITSVWSFGNGTSQTTTNSALYTSATYPTPGTYTVMLIATKGSCVDTAYKIITVDIPSKMEVPNVFTPNGDGNNDVFFLKVANLTEINAVILDRWGNKVYETTSSTGNIAWDGKNFSGKECASGVYFYIIKSKGKDGKEYEQKGNVSLFK